MTTRVPDEAPEKDASPLPEARVDSAARISWAWGMVALAIVFAAVLGWSAWRDRGVPIEIRFDAGHGLSIGDPLRYRGIEVGRVESVRLAEDADGVVVKASLDHAAAARCGDGTRFWIVRPRVDLGGIGGLDTIVGPRYIEVRPAGSRPQRAFVGLDAPPAVESISPRDLPVTLDAAQRGSLQVGSGVYCRGVRIGTVLSVSLAADAGSVEARLLIESEYAPLIRQRTRFFPAGAVELGLSLEGLRTRIDSLETLLLGGVGVATPPNAGSRVESGHRFAMDRKAEEAWLEWRPQISLGSELRDPPIALPSRLAWQSGGWFGVDRSVSGWVLPTEWGAVGPRSLLEAPSRVNDPQLQIGGFATAIETPEGAGEAVAAGLAVRPLPERLQQRTIANDRFRAPSAIEDLFIAGDPATEPRPLPAARLSPDGDRWQIDRSVRFPESMQGLAAVAVSDGRIVGVLVVEGRDAWVVPWE